MATNSTIDSIKAREIPVGGTNLKIPNIRAEYSMMMRASRDSDHQIQRRDRPFLFSGLTLCIRYTGDVISSIMGITLMG